MIYQEANRLGDVLKFEIDKNYCREVVTVASGQNLKIGTVVGIKSDTGEAKIVSIADGETDGSDKAFGVLLDNIDASAESKKALVLARGGIVASSSLVFPEGATSEQIAKLTSDLDARGIIVRQSA